MTQQYMIGELSLLLARLQAMARDHACQCELARLRHEAENSVPGELGVMVLRAVKLNDQLCWASLERGDQDAFGRQAAMGAELRGFAECAGLLE